MSENELNEPQPNELQGDPAKQTRRKFPGWLVALVLIVLIAIGILGGYRSGMGKRYAAQDTQQIGQLLEQFQLGQQAVTAKQYQVAKQHFDYIIQQDPNFPGLQSAYADLLVLMQITPSATPTLTPTVTPTPDTRSIDEIYNNVVALMSTPDPNLCGINWDDILSRLDSLRKADPTYHAADVDGMYYIALRSRGVCKIYPQSYEPNASCSELNINLEGGIYDLTLAEHFGQLDNIASAYRTWARLYITGASFWDQDWVQVLNYFSQVMAAMPQLADSTCTSATERYRQASVDYALYLAGQGAYCKADDQLATAIAFSPNHPDVNATATAIRDVCAGDASAPKPTKTPKP